MPQVAYTTPLAFSNRGLMSLIDLRHAIAEVPAHDRQQAQRMPHEMETTISGRERSHGDSMIRAPGNTRVKASRTSFSRVRTT